MDALSTYWHSENFGESLDKTFTLPKVGYYLAFINANPKANNVAANVFIRYNGTTIVTRSSIGDGTSYSGIAATAMIRCTSTTDKLRFTASQTTGSTSYNIFGFFFIAENGTYVNADT